jgi:hypothetical protein
MIRRDNAIDWLFFCANRRRHGRCASVRRYYASNSLVVLGPGIAIADLRVIVHCGLTENPSELHALPIAEVHEIANQVCHDRLDAILVVETSLALKHGHGSALTTITPFLDRFPPSWRGSEVEPAAKPPPEIQTMTGSFVAAGAGVQTSR